MTTRPGTAMSRGDQLIAVVYGSVCLAIIMASNFLPGDAGITVGCVALVVAGLGTAHVQARTRRRRLRRPIPSPR